MEIRKQLVEAIETLRHKRPLVHHITNYVTVNDCANVVLAIGASPVMADEEKEVEAMVSICHSLVLNIGTANERTLKAMIQAGKMANRKNIPVLLDPVGIGATPFRFESVQRLLEEVKFSVIRGNMAEIKTIAGESSKSAGVDSLDDETDGGTIAKNLALKLGCVIAMTGKSDIVSNGHSTYRLENGDFNLTKVTGTGCMTSSLIGSFLGSSNDALKSAIAGIWSMSIAGEIATYRLEKHQGIGSFKVYLMDAINLMSGAVFKKFGKITLIK